MAHDGHLVLLDAMALAYRAHFAFIARPITTSTGLNTSAVFGFTNTLLDLMQRHQPTHIAAVFDPEGPTARHEMFAEYKAQREAVPEDLAAAFPWIDRVLEAFRVASIEWDGAEADDVIGTLALRAVAEGFRATVVSPDKDFAQLVRPGLTLYRPGRMGDPPQVLDEAAVCEKWGIAHPRQIIDLLGLQGDSVDNIPGLPGIGEKTAQKLIAQFGDIETLLARTHELKGKQKETIETNRDLALLSKRLATIETNVPVPADWPALAKQAPDDDALRRLFAELEFNGLGRRLFGASFASQAGAAPVAPAPGPVQAELPFQLPQHEGPARPADAAALNFELNPSGAAIERFCAAARAAHRIGVHAVFRRVDGCAPELAGVGVACGSCLEDGLFVPADMMGPSLVALLADGTVEWVGHDLKPLFHVIDGAAWQVGTAAFDVMLAQGLVMPDQRRHLSHLAEVYLNRAITPPAAPFADDPSARRAAVESAQIALALRKPLADALEATGQRRVFEEVETPSMPALAAMERVGVAIDRAALEEFSAQLASRMAGWETRIHQLAGEPFNLNSPRQLGEVLFEKLQLAKSAKKTQKTGQYQTDEQTLMTLAGDHEIVRLILEYRGATKLKGTYVDALPLYIRSDSGRVHTTFVQLGAATGRLASHDPNLQNIPIRTEQGREIRKAFVPGGPEWELLAADYSQVELRIIAALSRDPGLISAFEQAHDIHTATAARVFNVGLDQVTPEMRRRAKMVNFGISYGMTAFGLAQRLNIPRREASEIIEQYFKKYPGIRRFMEETLVAAREKGYVETVLGRRRFLRDVASRNAAVRSRAEREAINAPIQGTAADLVKIAMARVHQALRAQGFKTRLLLQVHDELLFERHRDEAGAVEPLIESTMRTAMPLDVPIAVEHGIGANWLEAH